MTTEVRNICSKNINITKSPVFLSRTQLVTSHKSPGLNVPFTVLMYWLMNKLGAYAESYSYKVMVTIQIIHWKYLLKSIGMFQSCNIKQ